MLKYKYIIRIKYTEAISSNSIGNRYGLKLAKCWLQFKKKYKFIVSFVIIFGAYVHSPCASKSGICFKKCVSQSRTSLTLGLHADACFVRAYIACKPRYTAASASHAYGTSVVLISRAGGGHTGWVKKVSCWTWANMSIKLRRYEERERTLASTEKRKHCMMFSSEIFYVTMFKYSMTESTQWNYYWANMN